MFHSRARSALPAILRYAASKFLYACRLFACTSVRQHSLFELLVRLRPSSGSQVQEGPHRLRRTDMPRILFRLGRHEQQFGGPAQPDNPIRAFVKHSEDRHLLPLLVLAMIVPLEAIVGG